MVNIRKLALQAIERIIYKGGYANIVINEYLSKYEKIDIYNQIKPNIKILAKYIINNYNVI